MTNYKVFTGVGVNSYWMLFLRTVLFTLLFLLFTSSRILAQTKTITMDGREVIMHPNGKWEYAPEKKLPEQLTVNEGCKYSKNQVDNIKGSVVKMMEREKIIGYTPDEMRKIFTDSDYLTTEAYLTNFNNSIALLVKITIRTNNPHDAYGSIYKENKLILKLANGEVVTLFSGQSDGGNIDFAHDRTIYMTFFQLDDASIEKLKGNKVEMARLYWSKGYEDYKFAVPDFFIRQISCVK